MFLHHVLQLCRREHVLQGVVEWLEIRVDLVFHVARQESQFLSGLYCRTTENDFLNRLFLECFHRKGYAKIGFSRSGRTYGEYHVALVECVNELLLFLAAWFHRFARHGIYNYSLGHFVGGLLALHDFQYVLFAYSVELENMPSHGLYVFLESAHLLLVAQHSYHVVAGHNPEFREQCPYHLQMIIACPV